MRFEKKDLAGGLVSLPGKVFFKLPGLSDPAIFSTVTFISQR